MMHSRVVFATGLLCLAVLGCEPSSSPPANPPAPGATPANASPAPAAAPATSAQGASKTQPPGGAVNPGLPAAGVTAPGQPGSAISSPAVAGALVKTPSGLEYTVLKEGVGATPALGSKVKVQWTGTRASDGAVFFDTRKDGVPKEYKLDSLELITGWVETLQTMRTGEKRKVHVPSALAYGVRGLPEKVPPRTDVDFEIELVSFTPPGGK